ncbi:MULTISPECIES: FG-GAP-like repeat-containing protein [unclassified Spirosoma]|uniref:FG-GAP-like repeat-containing protein n=1 Tax=unclassified Spirosoma TaxID=2621999 RepID=UPI000966C8C8|nr:MULTISPECIES: FG-GAP-like repeat-containing protein [unclassified Spirosoma]MBN8824049.1 VCBS repeat-containing protein [Spirosoma sp.]OJW70450.1 MAG: RNA-binding protein [Spirosoma sp. 48-14]
MKFSISHGAWFLPVLCLFALSSCREKPLFERLDSSDTGITFANNITDSDTLNILNYQYIYNGGGVGVGDFNGDQKPDVFFAGNQVPNRLYINDTETGSGSFHFKDATSSAGVSGGGRWCSGVSVVDINADGKLDVYVSNTLHKKGAQRANLLYVNQGNDTDGNPKFREMAVDYGIADTTYSTHSAFFDYDNDGDLDLFVLVDQIADPKNPGYLKIRIDDGTSPNTDRLYRNDFDTKRGHAYFTDVTKQAGVIAEGFGLGVNICDINRDGWKDIYVTNDFASNDVLYINNHDGTFTNRAHDSFKHTSSSAMGNDVADINGDGLADIVCMDMLPEDNLRKKSLMGPSSYFAYQEWDRLGYEHQYARNTLQLNQGVRPTDTSKTHANMPIFSEISMLAGVAETEWSWSPLLVDLDHDGYRDLLVTNGFPRDVTDRDFTVYYSSVNTYLSDALRKELTDKIPQVKVSNYAFHNRGSSGTPAFENVTELWGMTEPSFSNGAAYADFDGDGDLDYVINNINDEAFVYRNNLNDRKPENAHYLRIQFEGDGANRLGLGALVEYELPDGRKEFYEHTLYRGFLSSVDPIAHFGLGKEKTIKNLKVTWPGGRVQIIPTVNADQLLVLKAANAQPGTSVTEPKPVASPLMNDVTAALGITYRHEETDIIDFNLQKTLLHKLTEYGPALAVGDVNGDGFMDMVVGGSSKFSTDLLLQQANGHFDRKSFPAKLSEDAGILLFDADGDGDLDLYAASGSPEVGQNQLDEALLHRLYVNDGKGNFTVSTTALPNFRLNSSCVKAADIDRDGDLDLFVGGRVEPYKYPMGVRSYLLRNEGGSKDKPHFTDATAQMAPALTKQSLTCDALWTDYDNDGYADLLLAGEWAPLLMLHNEKGRLTPVENSGLSEKSGFWNSLTPGDFDNDGDIDYLAGNLGQNNLLRATPERPVRIYAGDFDNNGFYDAFPTVYFKNAKGQYEEYPYFGWDDMVKQMIGIKKRYLKYAPFGEATINQILTDDERSQALKLTATYLSTSYIENKGNGKFEIKPLPIMAQAAPVFGMLAQDIDGDGNLDAVLVGNEHGSDLVAGRMDAFNGLVLKGDGKGGFQPITIARSGFYVPGNAKALVSLPDAQGHCRIATTENRGPLRLFAVQQPQTFTPVDAKTTVVSLRLKNGKTRRQEIPFGNTFYGQSARGVWLLPGEQIVK